MERDELLVERFPILQREKQIQFLLIHHLIPASITPGFHGSMANLSPLLSASLLGSSLFLSLLPFLLRLLSIHQHSYLPVCCKGKWKFCRSGSALLLSFQVLAPGACNSSLHPPLYLYGFSINLKLFLKIIIFGINSTETWT